MPVQEHPSLSARALEVAAQFRSSVPALSRVIGGRRAIYLDSPGGSQMPEPVVQAVTTYIHKGMANRHGAFATSEETEVIIGEARQAIGDLLGAQDAYVVFGQNMTSLAFALATSIGRGWQPYQGQGRVVVSEIDHHANVGPWVSVAQDHDMDVAWLPVDVTNVRLDLTQLEKVVAEQTKLVAVSLAANAVGTVQDVRRIADCAHAVGAIVIVDAVHAVPHVPVDMQGLGADVVFCSAYKFFGPHVGIMAIRRELLDRVRTYKVAPAPERGPDKAETGSQNHEAIAGLAATVSFLAEMGNGETRAARIRETILSIKQYEDDLTGHLISRLQHIPGLHVYRAPDPTPKTPTVAFALAQASPADIARFCGDRGVLVTHGDFYASTLAERLGVSARGGWVRAGMAPYITMEEIDYAADIITLACSQ